ncbi:hypothetical protein D9613_008013 [Agrocybe pediades]|uniref:Protein kinase domain-containing protein n=1 Tax=Agrocybe pediades TaxID=84607 RepID=A0A8H4VMG3_9AGAR|nr:hypothetical protein D9613_008013 [Agrocybe pediades]
MPNTLTSQRSQEDHTGTISSEDDIELGLLLESERIWVTLQPHILRRGYRLRPRYDPDWTPSWLKEDSHGREKYYDDFEDSIPAYKPLLDAVRLSDNQKVVLKLVETNTQELPISLYLSSPDRRDPRNRSVPVLDVILIPGNDEQVLMVMPCLLAMYKIPFRRVGELCEAAVQILESFEFLHEHNIAHRDVSDSNIALDSSKVIPKGYHFYRSSSHEDGAPTVFGFKWNSRWSVRPNRYYIIDFGLSVHCSSKSETVVGEVGQDRTVPEMSDTIPYNPFTADIYQLGNMFYEFIDGYDGFDDFRKLAEAMTRKNPAQRPTVSEAIVICKNIIQQIKKSGKMSKRVWARTADGRYMVQGLEKIAMILFGWNPLY